MKQRNLAVAVAVMIAVLCSTLLCSTLTDDPMSAAPTATPGVTATTIRVGIPYVDLSAVKALGVNISWGSVPDAFNAVIANINAHGGIDDRKIVPYIVAVDPTGTAPAATACTQLTEDDTIFVAVAPLQATCYLEHDVPVVASIYASGPSSSAAQDFTTTPPGVAYDDISLPVYEKQGVFKHKKVGLFGGDAGDGPELASVQSELGKLHVPVVTTAVDSAPQGDLPAENQEITSIAQRFQSDGVNEVVAVGQGSAVWPEGLSSIQSTYNPPWVATSESDFTGAVGGSYSSQYLANVVTSSPLTPPAEIWDNAGTQQCVHTIKKAFPSDQINAYSPSLPESQATFMSVELACTDMALFVDIAKAAGKDLTVSSFVRAGYGLKDLALPGTNAPVSFGPGRPYALGPVYMVHYDTALKAVVYADTSSTG
jgi:Periplasmic binding protein